MPDAQTAFRAKCRDTALLCGISSPLVFGEGPTHLPRIMLIGEAPGRQEEAQGRPFVGKAGKNLDGFLEVLGLHRQDIYITNAVKFRPVRVSPKGTVANRTPTRKECKAFQALLMEEIALVRPGCIVTLGNTPLSFFDVTQKKIGDVHGQLLHGHLNFETCSFDYTLVPLYHPAAIIYRRELQDVYHEDLRLLRDAMEQGLI